MSTEERLNNFEADMAVRVSIAEKGNRKAGVQQIRAMCRDALWLLGQLREALGDNERLGKQLSGAASLTTIQRNRADAAEARLAAVRAVIDSWPDGDERASDYAAARGQCKRAVLAALDAGAVSIEGQENQE